MRIVWFLCIFFSSLLAAPLNMPYNESQIASDTLFSAYSTPPKHLDPVVSYSSNEWAIISQIYETPLQYAYLKRPYTLEPLLLASMPETHFLDAQMRPTDRAHAAYTRYRFRLREDIYYALHPAFVKDRNGSLRFGSLTRAQVEKLRTPYDLKRTASRRVNAEDMVYAIKRMALSRNHSPIYDVMRRYIVGLEAFRKRTDRMIAQGKRVDLRTEKIEGVKIEDDFTYTILIKGVYPQFLYWQAMNFFAPIPWEAERFYDQAVLKARNITLDTYPVGTGAYYLAENIPYRHMILQANPRFHTERFPAIDLKEAERLGADVSVVKDANKTLPFIKRAVYTLEKEQIPFWNKFLQGYYDASGVGSETFDQAVQIATGGKMRLSESMRRKGIRMYASIQPSVFYTAFNMRDETVGGYDEKKRKLRHAISIAHNIEEYISIFMNGRAKAAQGPIPPGIFGYENDYDPYVYEERNGKVVRKSIDEAKRLLAEAGYPNGIDPKTGEPLKLYFDAVATGPDDRALLEWRRKQFAKLGIELVIRATDYNRFQEKVRMGKVQLFSWGWNADYPDAENFLFLLYGPNGVVATGGAGVNSANYDNPVFNALFERIRSMPDSPERLVLIRQAVETARKDAPWIWGVYPTQLTLVHGWYRNIVSNPMANNTLKYRRIDAKKRLEAIERWNTPVVTPLYIAGAFVLAGIGALVRLYRRRMRKTARQERGC